MKVLFLDIDGVLNGHDWCEGARSNTIRQTAIAALNVVLAKAQPKIVLSSAWRYMIHGRAMKLGGFEYLLRTHGACGVAGNMIGVTCRDEECCYCGHLWRKRDGLRDCDENGCFLCVKCGKPSDRGGQISAWLKGRDDVERYVAVDDEDYGITAAGHPLVQTNGGKGLTERDARRIVKLLRG